MFTFVKTDVAVLMKWKYRSLFGFDIHQSIIFAIHNYKGYLLTILHLNI